MNLFQNILDRWRINGWVNANDFVDLSGALNRSLSYLCSDKTLLHLLFIYAKSHGSFSFNERGLKRLIEDPKVWLANYFSEDLVLQTESGGMIVAKDIALNYWQAKKQLFVIEEINKNPNQEIYVELLVGNSLLRRDCLYKSINQYPQINKFFRSHEVLLYDTHHLRWLHIFNLQQDGGDILLNLETGYWGISRDFFDNNLVGLEFELFELADLPLFQERLYFPPDMAKSIADQFPSLKNTIAQGSQCWVSLFLPEIQSLNADKLIIQGHYCWNNLSLPDIKLTKSAKQTVIKVLAEQNYQSPFGINL